MGPFHHYRHYTSLSSSENKPDSRVLSRASSASVPMAHSQVEALSPRSLGSLIQPSLTHVYRGDIYTSVYVLGCVFLV